MHTEPTLSRLDLAFADFIGQRSCLSGAQKTVFTRLIARLSEHQGAGHSCLRITEPERELLCASGCLAGSEKAPLVVEQDRLYTHRYWQYEQRLASQLKRICQRQYRYDDLTTRLNVLFPSDDTQDGQKQAARQAVTQAFCIITGGPGTGKTTTVVKILALLQDLSDQPLYIALAAPTGKAAMRLQESIGANKSVLPVDDAVKQRIPEHVSTLHHLLGARPPSPYFRHDSNTPLPYDLVVVDEASMIDLALMSKLVDALKPDARLMLLGDKNQLASVESGAVLADLTASLPSHTLELRKSYRFQREIKALADAIHCQQADSAWALLQDTSAATALLRNDLVTFIVDQYRQYWQLIAEGAGFAAVFQAFSRFRVLCSNRHGPRSTSDINFRVEQYLIEQGKISGQETWYVGRPVMVIENCPAVQLYNGDIGLCLRDPDGRIRAHFSLADGRVKTVLPARLPRCETVYAMTIHKSQGSEFDLVLLVLAERFNPVLTKELLYTGITRAKLKVIVAAEPEIFQQAVEQRVSRHSGLAEKISATDSEVMRF